MLEKFVNSVLIIDDNEDEIKDLKKVLGENDIDVSFLHYKPKRGYFSGVKKGKLKRNRKLIFLDLELDPYLSGSSEIKIKNNISTIIEPKLFKYKISNSFGLYGIVLWSKHSEFIDLFREKISKSNFSKPLFIVGLDKTKYLREGFNNVLNDLNEILNKSIAANFFINWSNLIRKGRDSAISSIFELIPDYQKQDKNLEFLLFKMAQNYTGIPFDKIDKNYLLSIDAIKAFNDLLVSEINSYASSITIFQEKNKISFEKNDGNSIQPSTKIKNIGDEILNLYANFNSKLFLDYINIQQDKIIPGNVYEIVGGDLKLKHPDLPDNAIPIIIEMTPPCDFSNPRSIYTYPRVLSGYIMDLDISKLPNKEKFYKELWPIKLEGKDKPQIIIFDFSILGLVNESDLKNASKNKLLFRVKDKLFADILQKMSAYTARLGLPIIR